MNALSFLIFFFIAESNIVSTSKGEQSFLGGKEDFSPSNKKRKLAGGENYIKATIQGVKYDQGNNKFKGKIDSRNEATKVLLKTPGSSTQTDIINGQITSNELVEMTIYFGQSIGSLSSFFKDEKDSNCKNIKTIDFSHFDSSQVTVASRLFDGCSSLESVIFGNFYGSKVTTIQYMFASCSKIKSIDLSWLTGESLDEGGIAGLISNCYSLISIDLSKLNNNKLTTPYIINGQNGNLNIQYINLYESGLTKNQISNLNTQLVKFTHQTLYICVKPENFINPNGNSYITEGVKVKRCCNTESKKCDEPSYITVNYKNGC